MNQRSSWELGAGAGAPRAAAVKSVFDWASAGAPAAQPLASLLIPFSSFFLSLVRASNMLRRPKACCRSLVTLSSSDEDLLIEELQQLYSAPVYPRNASRAFSLWLLPY